MVTTGRPQEGKGLVNTKEGEEDSSKDLKATPPSTLDAMLAHAKEFMEATPEQHKK